MQGVETVELRETVTMPATTNRSELRPVERRVLDLVDSGVAVDEIAHRFRRSPEHIERVIQLAQLPGRSAAEPESGLRPYERCVLGWRAKGVSYDEIAPHFRRSPGFLARVVGLAQYKISGF